MLADQNRLEAFFHQLLARPGNRVDAGFEGLGNLASLHPVASFRDVSFQQNTCFGQLPGGVFAHMYQRVETLPLLIAERHYDSLHAIHFAVTMHLRIAELSAGKSPPDQDKGTSEVSILGDAHANPQARKEIHTPVCLVARIPFCESTARIFTSLRPSVR